MIKYCVNARNSIEVLKKADQIFFGYKDIDVISDYIEKYPDKFFIYEILIKITSQL